MDLIYTLIAKITEREITYDDDFLNAISGVLRLFERLDAPILHLQGIPLLRTAENFDQLNDFFVYGLRWSFGTETKIRRLSFPSWTWAGWEGNVILIYKVLPLETARRWQGKVVGLEDAKGPIVPFVHAASHFYGTENPPVYLHIEGLVLPENTKFREDQFLNNDDRVRCIRNMSENPTKYSTYLILYRKLEEDDPSEYTYIILLERIDRKTWMRVCDLHLSHVENKKEWPILEKKTFRTA